MSFAVLIALKKIYDELKDLKENLFDKDAEDKIVELDNKLQNLISYIEGFMGYS